MERPNSLRERKKEATRLAMHQAAVRLVAERGWDAVTVEAITEAVTVSRRTFSNYFSSKEEALLYGHQVRLRRLTDLARRRPATEPAWQALTAAVEDLIAESGGNDPLWEFRPQVYPGHQELVYQQVVTFARAERALAEEIAGRLAPRPDQTAADQRVRARVLAAVFLTSLRVAVRISTTEPGTDQAETLRATIGLAREYFD